MLLTKSFAATPITLAWRLAPTAAKGLALTTVWLLVPGAGLSLAGTDVAVRRLPNPVVLTPAAALVGIVAVAAAVSRQPWALGISLADGVLLAGAYLLLAVIGGRVGIGDVRLAGLLGLALGTVGWAAVLLGAAQPYLLAIPNAATGLRCARNPAERQLPFGPYLVAGALLAASVFGA
ncbi:prepilin peptidase [Plantactinospora sonchi]|uniref:Prepilin peptidase n=1 Tax=Plantactinospora sonchi TaxID=1544735 RepID=A0ABU7RUF9_9ACTN